MSQVSKSQDGQVDYPPHSHLTPGTEALNSDPSPREGSAHGSQGPWYTQPPPTLALFFSTGPSHETMSEPRRLVPMRAAEC